MKTDLLTLFFQVCWDFQISNGFQHSAFGKAHCFRKGIVQNGKYILCSGDVTHHTVKAKAEKGKTWMAILKSSSEGENTMGKQSRIEGGQVIWLMCKCLSCLASLLFTNIKFITGVYRYLQALVIGILVICFYEKFSIKVFVCHTFQASSESQ